MLSMVILHVYIVFRDVSLFRVITRADSLCTDQVRQYVFILSPCSRYARFCICACSSSAITCTPSRALITLCGWAGLTAPLLFACNKVRFLATRCLWCINARNHVFGVSNNKGAHQPVHPRSLISAFVIRLLERLIHLLQAKFQVSNLCS